MQSYCDSVSKSQNVKWASQDSIRVGGFCLRILSSQHAKYAGGGAFAVGGVAAAHYLYRPDLGPEPKVTTTTRTETGLPSTTQPLPELRVSCVPDENASWQDLVFLDGQVFEQVTARAFW